MNYKKLLTLATKTKSDFEVNSILNHVIRMLDTANSALVVDSAKQVLKALVYGVSEE